MPPISTKDLNLYKKEDPEIELPLSTHLEELRQRILISLVTLFVSFVISLLYSKNIIYYLTLIAPQDTIFIQIKPGEFFFTCMRVAFYGGFAISLPVIIFQSCNFVFPGLRENEKKLLFLMVILTPFSFILGTVFAYYAVLPSMLGFLFGFGGDMITTSISIENYIAFSIMVLAICGVAFLMPAVLFVLGKLKLISSKFLISQWRYAVLLCVVLGAVLTPTPDPFNMILISGVLVFLYIISILVLKLTK